MKADSKIIKTENKIPKEKVYQFKLEDGTIEEIKSTGVADLVAATPGWTAVTEVPPVLPDVLVRLYCTPLTKTVAFLSLSIAIFKW